MKARMHLTGPMKKVIEEYANEIVEQRQKDIATRAQYQWGMAMYLAGLSPRTINRVIDLLPAVADKYRDLKTDQLADDFFPADTCRPRRESPGNRKEAII